MKTPYASAGSEKARSDILKILRRFECTSVGFMDEFDKHTVVLAFVHRGRRVQLHASAEGWAQMWLRENPWNSKRYLPEKQYRDQALNQGMLAVNSILRDWVKAQVNRSIRSMTRRKSFGGLEMSAYKCPYCGSYHAGTLVKGMSPDMVRRRSKKERKARRKTQLREEADG